MDSFLSLHETATQMPDIAEVLRNSRLHIIHIYPQYITKQKPYSKDHQVSSLSTSGEILLADPSCPRLQASPRKPCSGLSCAERSSQAQSCLTHWEITDKIPKQCGELNQGSKEGEDSAMKLRHVSRLLFLITRQYFLLPPHVSRGLDIP